MHDELREAAERADVVISGLHAGLGGVHDGDCDEVDCVFISASAQLRRALGSALSAPPPDSGRATGLTWTKKKPTVAGAYWLRIKGGRPTVVFLRENQHGLYIERASNVGEATIAHHSEWAGPIPEPGVPPQQPPAESGLRTPAQPGVG